MNMDDINLENFLRDLETEIIQPPMDVQENQVLRHNSRVTPQELAVLGAIDSLLMDDTYITPLTAAIPPPNAVIPSPPPQQRNLIPGGSAPSNSAAANKRRARAAHSLSERKRRGRINENIESLQKIIPYSKKSDKLSMLGDACEFVKSAKLLLEQGRQSYMQEMEMCMNPTMVSHPAAAVPFYTLMAEAANLLGPMWNPQFTPDTLMAEAANLLGPMWNPQFTPGLYPFYQVNQLPNQDQQEQNHNP